jgi:hypothetical protein
MVCVCGARLPVNNPSSICHHCLKDAAREDGYYDDEEFDEVDEDRDYDDDVDESMDGDHESGLASAGFGNDEDYGHYDELDEWL